MTHKQYSIYISVLIAIAVTAILWGFQLRLKLDSLQHKYEVTRLRDELRYLKCEEKLKNRGRDE
jgi:hypothetical protein